MRVPCPGGRAPGHLDSVRPVNLKLELAIALDSSNNAYITGTTLSSDFPTASPFQAAFGGGLDDSFVTKLNAAGSGLVYSTFLGGSGNENGEGIAIDSAGNAYVTGPTDSTNFPTANPFQATFGGVLDAFVTKLSGAGNSLVYSTYLGGAGRDGGNDIAVDSSGCAYVTGGTSSLNFPTLNAVQPAFAGGRSDAFVSKVNAPGTALTYSTYLGGGGEDNGSDIAVDSSGSAHATGDTRSSDFPTTNAIQSTFGGGNSNGGDVFVAKLNAAGSSFVYSTYLGGGRADFGSGIVVDAGGNAFVGGRTDSADFSTTPGSFQPGFGGFNDGFVAKIFDPPSAVTLDFFLHGAGVTANPPTLFLDNTAPAEATAKFKDSPAISLSGGNPWKEVGTWTAAPSLTSGPLTALSDAHVWLGLKNSDDQGTDFDVRVEVYLNAILVASGEVHCIEGVTRNPSKAKETIVPIAPFSTASFNGTTDVLSLKMLTRIGTDGAGGSCAGHSNVLGLRVYFDAVSRPSRFDATFGP